MLSEPCAPMWHRDSPEQAASRLRPGEVHLWLLSLDEPALEPQHLARLVSPDERARADRYRFECDRRRFIAGRALLRWVLGHYTGIDPALLSFDYSSNGKPCLATPTSKSRIHFNLSHSGAWAVIGLTQDHPIGVDLEIERELPEMLDLAHSNFAAAEVSELQRLPMQQRLAGFFACWTRKEAFVKAMGTGLSMPLDQFEVSVDPGGPAMLRSIGASSSAARAWSLLGLQPLAQTWMAAAVNSVTVQWHIYRID